MVLQNISKWNPFRIDALGLVTMLGAEEVDNAVGRLVENSWVEYLPLLAAFTVAGNRFVQPKPGYVLYNISDGIMATDLAGWLSRWLDSQKLNWNTTTLIWGVRQHPRSVWRSRKYALLIGCLCNSGLILLSVLSNDWFGFANALAMTTSVLVRSYLVQQNKNFLDRTADTMAGRDKDFVKTLCLLANGRAVTILAPRGLITACFLTTPRTSELSSYNIIRSFGWLGFGCHVICIGQAALFMQILTVVLMIVATVVYVRGIGCEEVGLGQRISVHREDPFHQNDNRTVAYTRLELSGEEEETMLSWSLMPQRSNRRWWEHYERLKHTGETIHRVRPSENG